MYTLPDPLPKPPGRPPGEPIIIKDPPRPRNGPEIDDSGDEDEAPEIRKPPGIVPEKRPPPAPWERADPLATGVFSSRPGRQGGRERQADRAPGLRPALVCRTAEGT